MIRNEEWFFVMGAPRSGTTLISYLVSLHENAECLRETHLPLDLFLSFHPGDDVVDKVQGWMTLSRDTFLSKPYCIDELSSGIATQFRLTNLLGAGTSFLKGDSAFAHCSIRDKSIMLTAACCSSIREMCSSPDTILFGDKSPEYCFWWALLKEIFPSCKLIFIERDPVANAESMVRCGFVNASSVEAGIEEVGRYNSSVLPHNIPGLHRMSLEDLEASPGDVICEMMSFLGLDIAGYPMRKAIDIIEHGNIYRSVRK